MDETLPFKAYVGDISYQLQNIETGEILISIPSASVTDDHQLQMIDVTGVPEGRYRFIALGNTDGTTVLTEGPIPLHADNQEHRDTYLIHDTLNLSTATPEHALDMNRTKGLLLVLTENAPDSLGRIDEQISNLQQYIDKVVGYSGETSVSKSFTRDISPAATLLTWTAPTVPGKKSALQISLFAKNKTTPYMILPSIELNMKRNEISVIKVNFVPTGVEIWIYLYGNWQKLHSMDITIIN